MPRQSLFTLLQEIKRKLFHHLAVAYMVMYMVLPRSWALWILFLALLGVSAVEFLRIRRPEINAWFQARFGTLFRESELLAPTGVFWMLLGSWLTMAVFTSKAIVLPALGFMVFGDSAAAVIGRRWGRHPWKKNPDKTLEGSAAFAAISAIWALFFLRWPVAIIGALAGAWIEMLPLKLNDNFWLPLLGGLALSVINLVLGGH